MADLRGFDASKIDPDETDFKTVPEGIYRAIITDSAMKPTKSGVGKYLELIFQVDEGEHKGSKLWARLNLENPTDMAVKIARRQLSAICRAIGVLTPNDSCELHGIPLWIKVTEKRDALQEKVYNEISGFYSRDKVPGGLGEFSTDDPSDPFGG